MYGRGRRAGRGGGRGRGRWGGRWGGRGGGRGRETGRERERERGNPRETRVCTYTSSGCPVNRAFISLNVRISAGSGAVNSTLARRLHRHRNTAMSSATLLRKKLSTLANSPSSASIKYSSKSARSSASLARSHNSPHAPQFAFVAEQLSCGFPSSASALTFLSSFFRLL